ncbi:putative RNA-directed DNA polymerase, eukaryota, reverse transcriptase zinc-binding domain protein [Tanacetum coccineum]
MVRDSSNVLHEGNVVPSAFVSYYEQFLGLEGATTPFNDQGLFTQVLSNHKAEFMVREVSNSEIIDALFSIGDDKAPGPDGFTAAFFKKSWDIVVRSQMHKIIANRIKKELRDLVSINQSAFVSGRRISDNILLTQELMRNYHRKRGPSRCAFKVDIQKAYDMVDWGFLRSILVAGLMRRVQIAEDFQYHHNCEQQRIVNLSFADDLFLFAKGHPNSVRVIIDAFEEFKNVSGLVPSIPKSTAFFCNVPNTLKANILSSMPFAEGTLPVKYLGVPLISSRLLYRDCKILVKKLESRVNDWRNKFLSLAGRLQLLMRGFLWCQGEMKKGKAKVAWEAVCLPHRKGGLGIRKLDDFNVALMATHVWCILINKESLWVQWIHSYKLRGRSFWDVPCMGDISWGWRKLLQIQTRIRPFIWHKINNGRSTSMWFDRWVDFCRLHDMLTVRNIVRSGFSLSNTVSDLISNESWRWPHDWSSRFPNVVNIPVSDINSELDDLIVWRDVHGVFHRFTVAGAWDLFVKELKLFMIGSCSLVPHCIPRHIITYELVIKEKLKTQDRLRQWDILHLLAILLWPSRLVDVLAFLIPSKGFSVSNVISQIVLAAMTYCLWNERNSRLFKKKKSTAD